MLLSDRQRDLRQQPADLDQISPPRFDVSALQLLRKQAVDFALRHAMVPAGRFHRLDLSVVDPLLQGGIADAQNIRRFPRRQQLLHDKPPKTSAYRILNRYINTFLSY